MRAFQAHFNKITKLGTVFIASLIDGPGSLVLGSLVLGSLVLGPIYGFKFVLTNRNKENDVNTRGFTQRH